MTSDSDFLAWRQGRDPRVLARVFDATASSLLLLAVHLTRDQEAAEELVQTTFLKAMQSADRYDAARPLLPWLGGILQNEARNLSRRRARDQRLQESTDAPPTERPTLDSVAERETVAQVLQAIENMSNHYRQVLNLRLVHGLSNVEIAHSLGIPEGTVRARAHRGLELLRNKLPAGIATTAVLLLGGRGLAAVREVVVQQATAMTVTSAASISTSAGTASASSASNASSVAGASSATVSSSTAPSTLAGLLAMKHAWTLAAAAAALFLGWFGYAELWDEGLAGGTVGDADRVAEQPERNVTDETALAYDKRTPLPKSAAVPDKTKPDAGWVLRGVVRSQDKKPVAGVRVSAKVRRGYASRDLAHTTTDDEGRYEVRLDQLLAEPLLLRATSAIYIDAHAKGYWPAVGLYVEQNLSKLPASHVFEENIELRRGRVVVGRVLDAEGRPVRDAQVRVLTEAAAKVPAKDGAPAIGAGEGPDKDPGGWPSFEDLHPDNSDAAGRFVAKAPDDTQGSYVLLVGASDRGSAVRHLEKFGRGKDAQVVDVGDIRLQDRGVLEGVVVLGDGTPVPDTFLSLMKVGIDYENAPYGPCPRLRNGSVTPHLLLSGRTDEQGRFRFAGLAAGETYQVTVRRVLHAGFPTTVRAGDQGIRIVVPSQLLTLRILDQEGQPLPGAPFILSGWHQKQLRESGIGDLETPTDKQLPRPMHSHYMNVGRANGEYSLLVPFGSFWTLRHGVAHAEPVLEYWRAKEGVHRARVDLRLAINKERGRFQVYVENDAGKPVTSWKLHLRRLPKDRNKPMVGYGALHVVQSKDLKANDQTPALAAGRYHATIYAGSQAGGTRTHPPATATATIVADKVMPLHVKVTRKSILRLHLKPPQDNPPKAWDLRVTVEAGGGENEMLFGLFDQIKNGGYETKRYPLVGHALVCGEPLAPGRRMVHVKAAGFRDVMVNVDFEPGEVHDLRVDMIRK